MDFAECLRKCGFVSGKETAAECYFSNEAGDEVWGRKDTQGKFIEIQLKIKNKWVLGRKAEKKELFFQYGPQESLLYVFKNFRGEVSASCAMLRNGFDGH